MYVEVIKDSHRTHEVAFWGGDFGDFFSLFSLGYLDVHCMSDYPISILPMSLGNVEFWARQPVHKRRRVKIRCIQVIIRDSCPLSSCLSSSGVPRFVSRSLLLWSGHWKWKRCCSELHLYNKLYVMVITYNRLIKFTPANEMVERRRDGLSPLVRIVIDTSGHWLIDW